MAQVLSALVRPRHLEALQPRWLHVLVEAGKEEDANLDWAGQVKAIGNEVRTHAASSAKSRIRWI